jgi:hypothetical protein
MNQDTSINYEAHLIDVNTPLNGIGIRACPALPAPPPRANKCSAHTKTSFRVYSHNVNGLQDETKLEFIPLIIIKKDIDAYLIQEMHLAGDFEKQSL